MMSKDELAEPLRELQAALDRWLGGGSTDDVLAAIGSLEGPFEQSRGGTIDDGVLTREDKIASAAIRYRRATTVAATLSRMAHEASAIRDEALAALAEAHAVPPAVPIYAVRFIQGLIAEGAGQADLHPASRRRLKATLRVLREIAPTGADGKLAPYLLPPVRVWAELPREFAGFRLDDVDPNTLIFDPAPLPPFTDIADYTEDRIHPGEGETRDDTYRLWNLVLQRWAKEQGNGTDGRPVMVLDGSAIRTWLLLLGHRLSVPKSMPRGHLDQLVITSPWNPDRAVRPVWIGST